MIEAEKHAKQMKCPHCDEALYALHAMATQLGNGQVIQFVACASCMKPLPYVVVAVEQPKIISPFAKN